MNGFSPQRFNGYVSRNNGIATGNRYQVEIGKSSENRDITLLCHNAKVMGRTFNLNSQIYGYGSEYNLPVGQNFEDFSLSFHCTYGKNYETDGLPEYRFFNNWMDNVINTGNVIQWKKDYQKDIYVNLLNGSDDIIWRQKFISSIPISISELELSSAGTELLTFDVTFTYDSWLANVK